MAPQTSLNLPPAPSGTFGWVYAAIAAFVIFLWRIKSTLLAVVKLFSALGQVVDLDQRVRQIETSQITPQAIDNLRTDLQNTQSANYTNLLGEIRYLFGSFKAELRDDIYRKYESLDKLTQRLSEKEAEIAAWKEKKNDKGT